MADSVTGFKSSQCSRNSYVLLHGELPLQLVQRTITHQIISLRFTRVYPEKRSFSMCCSYLSGDNLQNRALSAAVMPKDPIELSLVDCNKDIMQNRLGDVGMDEIITNNCCLSTVSNIFHIHASLICNSVCDMAVFFGQYLLSRLFGTFLKQQKYKKQKSYLAYKADHINPPFVLIKQCSIKRLCGIGIVHIAKNTDEIQVLNIKEYCKRVQTYVYEEKIS